ncbi:hypothetical protein [Streptomyces himalayensis]|uniref:hypothetical protein n=1 Tax=Streptomyces himalayensis TaxID=2820085 RepID=UPI001FE3EF10|nr:hypothetical protein [Streptomyces himalayensis]
MSDVPLPGTVVVDERQGRVGQVMGTAGPYLQLRPLGGGKEWDACPEAVRVATPAERLSAGVAAANAASRRAEGCC